LNLEFFDCSIGIFGSAGVPAVFSEAAALFDTLSPYRISKALVFDRGAVEGGDLSSFNNILRFCAGYPAFLPMVPVVPPACGEQEKPEDLIGMILESTVGAVGVWPAFHHFDLALRSFNELFGRMETHRIPLVYHTMGHGDHPWLHQPDWRGIREIASEYPALPIIVTPTGMLQGRNLLPLLAECGNIRVDLSCETFGFIEYVTRNLGASRLICASRLPFDDPGLMTSHLLYADISEEEKSLIAYSNINNLVGAIR
jgi:predicted TIM-barrel fold metal-dependent hydrolase